MVTVRPTVQHWKKRTKQLNPPILTQVRDQIMKPKAQRTLLCRTQYLVRMNGKLSKGKEKKQQPRVTQSVLELRTSFKTDVDSIKDSRDLGQSWQRKEG